MKSLSVTIQIKATGKYFEVVLFVTLCRVFQTFWSVGEILNLFWVLATGKKDNKKIFISCYIDFVNYNLRWSLSKGPCIHRKKRFKYATGKKKGTPEAITCLRGCEALFTKAHEFRYLALVFYPI